MKANASLPRATSSRSSLRRAVRHVVGALAFVALAAFPGCDIHVHPSTDAAASIPAAGPLGNALGLLSFAGFDNIQLSEQIQNQGVTDHEVDSVVLQEMTITITDPQGQTFDFIQAISFTVSATGLPDLEIASLESIPKGQTTLTMNIDPNVELKPYVVAPSMTISTMATGQSPQQQTDLGVHVVFDVAASLPGCSHGS